MNFLDQSESTMTGGIVLDPIVRRTITWSAFNSGTNNLEGLGVIAELLSSAFSELPGTVKLVEPAEVQTISAAGEVTPVLAGRHLVLRVRPEVERRVLLTGHMDTVYGVDDPFQATEWIDARRLRGPGVLDMKSGIAVMLAGLQAFETTKPALGYDVLINSDEETGSSSSAALISELASGKFAALTYEPSLPGGAIARSRPGSGNFSALVKGRAAHAGRNPEDGRNAVAAASDLALRLHRARRPGLSVNPAKIDGGGPNNVVPPLAVLRFNVRPRDPADVAEAIALVSRLVADVASEHDVAIELHGGIGRPAKPIDAATERLFAIVASAAADLGDALSWHDSGGVCDGNNIASCGVPVIDTMGACGDFIHSPREYVDTGSLVAKARLTALVLCRLAQIDTLR